VFFVRKDLNIYVQVYIGVYVFIFICIDIYA